MYTKEDMLTDKERVRLDELDFIHFIQTAVKAQANPIKLYDFLDILCLMLGCNYLVLSSTIPRILQQERTILPQHNELVYLLSKAGVPVRTILAELKMSQRTFYQRLAHPPMLIEPRFELKQTVEIVKFMSSIQQLLPERRKK